MALDNPFEATPAEPTGDFVTPDHKAGKDEPQPRKPFPRRVSVEDLKARREKSVVDSFVPDKVPNRKGQFVKPVAEFYVVLGMAVTPLKPNVGRVFAEQAQDCAEAWDKLAHENETVRRYLQGFLTVNTAGALLFAHIPIALAIAAELPIVQKRAGKKLEEEQTEVPLRRQSE